MKTQLISVGLLAVLAGMMTQGPMNSVASTEPGVPMELSKAMLETNQQIDRLEQLVKYRARWTFPGSIEGHMQAHGVETAGKTKEQLLSEHDAIHDVVGPVRAGEPIPQVTQVAYQFQDCPDGFCPVRKTVAGAAQVTGAVVRAVTPPYPRAQSGYSENCGSVGYSSVNYGSGGGYSQASYSSESFGSGGYSSSRYRGQPVRGFFRRVIGR